MSDVIATLRRVFDQRFIVDRPTIIDEPYEGMSRTLVRSCHIPEDNILVCRLDQESNPQVTDLFPYLRGKANPMGYKGMKRICDYVIFVDKDNELFVLLIELKKGDSSPLEQLNVTVPLIRFIFERAKILNHFDFDYQIRKIGITDKAGKRTTANRGTIDYDDDNYVKLYNSDKLYLQRMLH